MLNVRQKQVALFLPWIVVAVEELFIEFHLYIVFSYLLKLGTECKYR